MIQILQVDDDENDIYLFQHAMMAAEVANPVQVVTNGQQAIDYLKGAGKFSDRHQYPLPGLVLLDLKLPYVMGLDVLKWIRQQSGAPLIVILLTASAEPADVATAYRLGANAFLTKPTEAAKFVDMVKSIKSFWLTHNILPEESEWRRSPMRRTAVTADREPSINGSGWNKFEILK
jgi:CheY-like chemotaxis protein